MFLNDVREHLLETVQRSWRRHSRHAGPVDSAELDLRHVQRDGGRLQASLHHFQWTRQYGANRAPTSGTKTCRKGEGARRVTSEPQLTKQLHFGLLLGEKCARKHEISELGGVGNGISWHVDKNTAQCGNREPVRNACDNGCAAGQTTEPSGLQSEPQRELFMSLTIIKAETVSETESALKTPNSIFHWPLKNASLTLQTPF